jgi:hypothetical protein
MYVIYTFGRIAWWNYPPKKDNIKVSGEKVRFFKEKL